MKAFLRPYLNSIETFEDLIQFEKNNLLLFSVIYYLVSVFMFMIAFQLFPGKLLMISQSTFGLIYFSNVAGFFAAATLSQIFLSKITEIKTYEELKLFKKKFYLGFYFFAGVPFMAFIAWAIVYADLRFAFEMILAFIATAGALYFGDWKTFQTYHF